MLGSATGKSAAPMRPVKEAPCGVAPQRLKPWAPSMGPQFWHPYTYSIIYPICALKGP